MKLFIVFASFMGFVFGGLPKSPFHTKIINGTNAQITDFPYQALVKQKGIPVCGGSIVKKNIVLTSAHCTYGRVYRLTELTRELATSFKVHVGDANLYAVNGQEVGVIRIIQADNFDLATLNNDMALLILEKNLQLGDTVQTISLSTETYSVGEKALISGWGLTSDGSVSEVLQQLEVPIFEKNLCYVLYGGSITDKMLCAGYFDATGDACQGDSGGPLALNGKLIGVVSFGYECAKTYYPGVYASVYGMRNWLKENDII